MRILFQILNEKQVFYPESHQNTTIFKEFQPKNESLTLQLNHQNQVKIKISLRNANNLKVCQINLTKSNKNRV